MSLIHGNGLDMTVTLPWPPASLSPNTRQHWSALARAKKAYRKVCATQARIQGLRKIDANRLHLALLFVPPNRRAFDLDNLLARMKSGLDGLSDVLGVDDSNWTLNIAKADAIGGMVQIVITEVTP